MVLANPAYSQRHAGDVACRVDLVWKKKKGRADGIEETRSIHKTPFYSQNATLTMLMTIKRHNKTPH
jgi:hypothetical protein